MNGSNHGKIPPKAGWLLILPRRVNLACRFLLRHKPTVYLLALPHNAIVRRSRVFVALRKRGERRVGKRQFSTP